MKKGIYLVYSVLNIDRPDGIEKKVIAQKKMFEKNGIDMEFYILERRKGTYWNYNNCLANVDFIYFRKSTVIDWRFLSFFKRIKKDNPNVKILMEIPTYPYEGEFGNNLKSKISLMVDCLFRLKLKGIIDAIVVTGYNVGYSLWGVRAINIVNGIDVDSIPERKIKSDKDEIIISCIAKFSPWHGYERLIEGLYEYYKNGGKRMVKVIMVGEGVEKEFYQRLTREHGLEKYIEFTGQLLGEQLENIYDKTDIGCCSLGRYKSGIDVIGDLKSREFMAKGIPMICGCQIDVLNREKYPYAVWFANDSTAIDIDLVLKFYDGLIRNDTLENISKEIRAEAKQLVDFNKTFAPVLKEVGLQL